jgi:hypothetical protein
MEIKKIIFELGLKVFAEGQNSSVYEGYTSDLLSDVMANCKENSVWITIQRHMNVIAVAQLKKIAGIILPNGISPDDQVKIRAKDEGIYILGTQDNAFEVSGKIYSLLKK